MSKYNNINGGLLARAMKLRELPIIGFVGQIIMHCLSVDIPRQVKFGTGVKLNHNCYGTVMHPGVTIGNNVSIYHNVTLGRKYPYGPFGGIVVCDGAVIAAGAKVLAGKETLIVGNGSVVAANAVLTHSIGKNEVWAGIPAKKVKDITAEEMHLFRRDE